MRVTEELDLAIINARLKRPYSARALGNVTFVPSDVPKITSDKWWRIYYNPAQLALQTPGENGSAIAREVDRLLLRHADRAVAVGVTLSVATEWHRASNMEINDDLLREERPLLESDDLPSDIGSEDGQLAESYFARLLDMRDDRPGKNEGGHGDDGAETGCADQDKDDDGEDPGPSEGDSDGADGSSQDHVGSGSDGIERMWESGEPDGSNGGIRQGKAERVRMEVAKAIKAAGSVSDWNRWANLEPKVSPLSWQQILHRHVRLASARSALGRDDYSYSRRSRRQPFRNYIVPATIRRDISVTIVVDTSGSMIGDFEDILGHIEGVCRSVGDAKVIQCDSEIKDSRRVYSGNLELVGGGGTELNVAIEAADSDRDTNLIILITDGDVYEPWPTTPTRHPMIVVSTDKAGPEWATTVLVDDRSGT